jgi:glycosyltransferase involved in cell wall biosynthesis
MQEALPLVSVVMAVYNRAEIVPRAIRSVLAQSYEHVELIVVDDASTDRSAAIARSMLRPSDQMVVRSQNGGHNASINSALEVARGEIIAFCDSDDELTPDFLQSTVAPLLRDERYAFAYSRVVRGPEWTIEGCERLGAALEQGHLSAMGTLVVRRAALDPLLPLPERAVPSDMCNDDRISFELARRYCFAHVPEALYRIIGASDSVTKNDQAQLIGWDRLFTDYRSDIYRLCAPGTLARHRVTNVERAVQAGRNGDAARLAVRYAAEALRGPRRGVELWTLGRGVGGSLLRLVGRWLRSRRMPRPSIT